MFKLVNGKRVPEAASDIIARNEKEEAHKAECEANAYKEARKAAYPSIEEQLDTLYHEGIEGWRGKIAIVKRANPKPEKK